MSTILLNPHYCPEDKDILDFVNSTPAPLADLVEFLRKRGVYVSKEAKKPDLALIISEQNFTWSDMTDLLDLIAEPSKKENFIVGNHDSAADYESLEQAVGKVKAFRSAKYGDKIDIEAMPNGSYKITIEYTKIDYEKTRLIQCIEREAEIVLEKTPTGFRTIRTDSDRAAEVELAILGEYERIAKEDDHELVSRRLKLNRLNTVEKRVKFFVDLMEGLSGFSFMEIKGAKAQAFNEHSSASASLEEIDENEAFDEQYKSILESLTFKGKAVENTDIYSTVIGKNYFLSSATWVAVAESDECKQVELKASFVPVNSDFELQFSVVSVWMWKSGELQPRQKANALQKAKFSKLLIESSEKAYGEALK